MQILAVIVRHKTALQDSQTISSLIQAFSQSPELLSSIRILLWDNSPEALDHPELPFPFIYKHASTNVGLSGAFNHAAAMAQMDNIPWLLLFDQDTTVPAGFLSNMLRYAAELHSRSEIAAVTPTVYVGDFIASPLRMLFSRYRAYPEGEIGIAEGEAAAINSGTLLRVNDLLEIGGYSDAFWLDFSDYYVFHQLFLRKKLIWRAADIRLQHSMTVMDYDNLMSTWRYSNVIHAEGAFNDLFKGKLENAVQTLRLLARVVRQRRRFKNAEFSRITWRYFLARLFSSRQTRLQRWESSVRARVDSIGVHGTGQ